MAVPLRLPSAAEGVRASASPSARRSRCSPRLDDAAQEEAWAGDRRSSPIRRTGAVRGAFRAGRAAGNEAVRALDANTNDQSM